MQDMSPLIKFVKGSNTLLIMIKADATTIQITKNHRIRE